MFDSLSPDKLTASALVVLAVLMLYRGLLVPWRFYKDKCDESDRWRLAYETSEKARQEESKQNAEMFEVAKTTHALMLALFNLVKGNKPELIQGGQDVAS